MSWVSLAMNTCKSSYIQIQFLKHGIVCHFKTLVIATGLQLGIVIQQSKYVYRFSLYGLLILCRWSLNWLLKAKNVVLLVLQGQPFCSSKKMLEVSFCLFGGLVSFSIILCFDYFTFSLSHQSLDCIEFLWEAFTD